MSYCTIVILTLDTAIKRTALKRSEDSYRFYDASTENYHPFEFLCAQRAQSYDFKELVFNNLQPILLATILFLQKEDLQKRIE